MTTVAEATSSLRIGEAAERLGVSCRTLRYYDELGLLVPSSHSAGGTRRYSTEDVARLHRIRELQELLGFDLDEIGGVLRAEDDLADLRSEYHGEVGLPRRREILAEATAINDRLRETVRAKLDRLTEMAVELEEKAALYKMRAKELAPRSPSVRERRS